jgi:hypothetical protein
VKAKRLAALPPTGSLGSTAAESRATVAHVRPLTWWARLGIFRARGWCVAVVKGWSTQTDDRTGGGKALPIIIPPKIGDVVFYYSETAKKVSNGGR